MAFNSNENGQIINFGDNEPTYRSVQLVADSKQESFSSPLFDHHNHDTLRAIGGGYATSSSSSLMGLAPLPSLQSSGLKELSLSSVHHQTTQGDSFDRLMHDWPYTAPINNNQSAKELAFVVTTAADSTIDNCPPVPVYVEQYTTFLVNRPTVFDDIAAHLTAIGVDHSVHDHKIRGLVYPADRAGACEFRVFRYRCETAGEWMIEVQRRSGCIFAFNQLYRSIVSATSNNHIITSSSAASPSPAADSLSNNAALLASLPPLPTPSKPAASIAAEPTGDLLLTSTVEPLTVKQLTTMASSNAVEVAREGIEALAVMTGQSTSHAAAVANHAKSLTLPLSLLTIAATMVATARSQTARAAAELIANISGASREGVSMELSTPSLVSSLYTMLDAPSSLSLRDTKRHCARAIANMASTDIVGLRKATAAYDALPTSAFTGVAILERYSGTDDIALRTSIVSALNLLRA